MFEESENTNTSSTDDNKTKSSKPASEVKLAIKPLYGEDNELIHTVFKIQTLCSKTNIAWLNNLLKTATDNYIYRQNTSVFGNRMTQRYPTFPSFAREELQLICNLYHQISSYNVTTLTTPTQNPIEAILQKIIKEAKNLSWQSGIYPSLGNGKKADKQIFPYSALQATLEEALKPPVDQNKTPYIPYSLKL